MQNKMLLKTALMSLCAFHLVGVVYFMSSGLCVIRGSEAQSLITLYSDRLAQGAYISWTSLASFIA